MFKKTPNKRIDKKANLLLVLNCLDGDRKKWRTYRKGFGYIEPNKPPIVIIEGCCFYDVYVGERNHRQCYRYYFPFSGANQLFYALYPDREYDQTTARINAYLRVEENRIFTLI